MNSNVLKGFTLNLAVPRVIEMNGKCYSTAIYTCNCLFYPKVAYLHHRSSFPPISILWVECCPDVFFRFFTSRSYLHLIQWSILWVYITPICVIYTPSYLPLIASCGWYVLPRCILSSPLVIYTWYNIASCRWYVLPRCVTHTPIYLPLIASCGWYVLPRYVLSSPLVIYTWYNIASCGWYVLPRCVTHTPSYLPLIASCGWYAQTMTVLP